MNNSTRDALKLAEEMADTASNKPFALVIVYAAKAICESIAGLQHVIERKKL